MRFVPNIEGNISLIGPMGAGKTTVGKHLSSMLQRPFFDSDREIESRTGVTIATIFDVEGEDGFRKRECAIIDELTHKENIVLATGGGVVLQALNRDRLKQRCHVIYLKTSLEQLVKRTSKNKNRPLLQGGNPREKLRQIMEERREFYESTADIQIETGRGSVRSVCMEILRRLPKAAGSIEA
ncbi:MAG: shikimate kinase AroK [Pseudomonadota bacterium]